MGSLIEELQRREAAARREADELRGEIARLTERLARAEDRLSRLEITRETVAEILGGAGTGDAGGGAGSGRRLRRRRHSRAPSSLAGRRSGW